MTQANRGTRAGRGIGPPAGAPVQTAPLNPGPETFFTAGDGFTEVDCILHFGRNAGSGPLVLLVASLLHATMPPASPPP